MRSGWNRWGALKLLECSDVSLTETYEQEQKQLVLDGGKRMLSYMQPGANPCTDLYNHCCGNMLNDLFLESDVITRIENIPLKYNPERVYEILHEEIYSDVFMINTNSKMGSFLLLTQNQNIK